MAPHCRPYPAECACVSVTCVVKFTDNIWRMFAVYCFP